MSDNDDAATCDHRANGVSTIRVDDFKRPNQGTCRRCHEHFQTTWMPRSSAQNWFALRQENARLREQLGVREREYIRLYDKAIAERDALRARIDAAPAVMAANDETEYGPVYDALEAGGAP